MDNDAWLGMGCLVENTRDYLVISKLGSRNDTTTIYRTENDVWVSCGCFNDSLKEFEKAVKETHGNSKFAIEYLALVAFAKARFDIKE